MEANQKIPRKIHYCWFGNNPKSEWIKQCMESWAKFLPDYEVKEWNETNSPMDLTYIREAYSKGLWSKVSNYVRLYALYEEGGIYLDSDVEVIKSLDSLLENSCFLGFQQEQKHVDWINNAVMGSIPNHPFLKRCMDATLSRFDAKKTFYRSPEVTTRILGEMGLKEYGTQLVGDVTVYSVEYFYPYPWWEVFHPSCVKDNTYCIHHWQLSWVEKETASNRVRTWLKSKRLETLTPSMEVSIVIVAHNAAETIGTTLESLLAQTFRRWEAILIDDGSTDETLALAESFAQRDPRIHLLSQPHLGKATAYNRGIDASRLPWLLFLDVGDCLLPQYIEKVAQALRSDPTLDAVCCDWMDEVTNTQRQSQSASSLFCLLASQPLFPSFVCTIHRVAAEAAGNWDATLSTHEDWDFWQRVARTGANFGRIPEVLGYRQAINSASAEATLQHFIEGLRIITTGHSFDPRVPSPSTSYAYGLSELDLPCAKFNWVCWSAGLLLARGEEIETLLPAVKDDSYPQLDASAVAEKIFRAVLSALDQLLTNWAEVWPSWEQQINEFLISLEAQAMAPGLAQRARSVLETMILEHLTLPRPITVGGTHAIQLEVTEPVSDLILSPSVEQLRCEVDIEGQRLGVVELSVSDEFVSSDTIIDAITDAYAWPILGRFFEHTLYPSLTIEQDAAGVTLWRGSICLGTGLPQEGNTFWSVAHDQVGWALFLQELWNRPDWPNEKFYDPHHVEAPAPCSYFVNRQFNVEVSETLLDVVTNQQKLEVVLAVGGAKLGCVIVSVSENRVTAQETRVALTTMGGFDLCRLAVRQGLIGRPLTDPAPLRVRLLAAARQCHPDELDLNPLRKILLSLQKSGLAEWLQK